jgi:tetratricopeptide (TPR) repeat protein
VNRYADAKSTALRAVALGKDSYGLHAILYQIAFAEHDQAAMSHETSWSRGRPSEWFSLYVQALAAATAGKYRQAEELFHDAYGVAQRQNLIETADNILIGQGSMEFDLGLPAAARATLSRVRRQDTDKPDLAFEMAELGDIPFAERFLAVYGGSTSHPGTLMTYAYLPRLRAEIALHQAKPLEAIAALKPAAPYELAGGLIAFAQRGEAYRRAGQAEKAADEYKNILAHQGVDPLSPLFPLAHLWLGRNSAQAGHVQASRSEYEKLFALWKDADKDLPVLLAARREYAALPGAHR